MTNRPSKVRIHSSLTGEELDGATVDWAPPTDETGNPELIELPYLTNGYRRRAQAQFGTPGEDDETANVHPASGQPGRRALLPSTTSPASART